MQSFLPFEHELVVDLFAGGGGASEAMRLELGREPDIAINHDEWAIAMHEVNHPHTRHYQEDVYDVDPLTATRGRPVGLLHASPDCTHHSQAKGGQPRSKEVRALSWVVHKWAGKTKPRCITLENVEQIQKWCPLIAKRDPETGRVVTLDIITDPVTGAKTHRIADPSERVPVRNQFLVPDPKRTGETWRRWLRGLSCMGYKYLVGKLAAHKYGAGTSRERLFVMARRDGLPINWPEPTHGKGKGLKPVVSAADSIDWSIPCPSIFDREKPLVDATLRRIAKGAVKHVLECADPFIVPVTHSGSDRVHPASDPLRTITTAQRGEFMVCSPMLSKVNSHGWDRDGGPIKPADESLGTIVAKDASAIVIPTLIQTSFGERKGQSPRVPGLEKPLGTIVAGGIKHAVVTAFMEQAHEALPGRDARESLSTIVGKGCTQRVVAASLATLRKHMVGTDARDPLRAIAAGGEHHAVLEYQLSPEIEAGALRVAAFLISYYTEGGGQFSSLRNATGTISTRDRLALVTVTIRGIPHVIVDIGLRMLTARELFRAQGFPDTYIIDRTARGRSISKTHQVRMVGNSVSPPPYQALLRANFQHEQLYEAQVA